MPGLTARLSRWWEREAKPGQEELGALYLARLTDVAANRVAQQWCESYTQAGVEQRSAMLARLAHAGTTLHDQASLASHASRLLRRLSARGGLGFMVALREDMLLWRREIHDLALLERELEQLLAGWFDVSMLELHPITWDSPASLLEKLIHYEAVHEIRSWDDLKHRVSGNRRCYAFFHPRMPGVPLIFVEIALAPGMADTVQALLDPEGPQPDPRQMRWAIFYSISSTQAGLRGISFGNFLLKRVIEELQRDFPRLKGFATLSPMPGFARWLARNEQGKALVAQLREAAQGVIPDELRKQALALGLEYLTTLDDGQPIDPVARFHLGNGARLERLNWAADLSPKGLQQSCSIMVNYLYDPDRLDQNLQRLAEGKPAVARGLRWR